MSKSAIYTVNNTLQTVADGGTIDLGIVQRRFGCNLNLVNNAIREAGAGYYDIQASITAAPTAEGEITISVYKNNILLPGATATVTAAAAGDNINLAISALDREKCNCCDDISNLTFVVSQGETNISNISVKVVKL